VFNPSPHPRTDLVRFALDPFPAFPPGHTGATYHPLLVANREDTGFTLDGQPVRRVPTDPTGRFLLDPSSAATDIEFVARDVPAFGWRRFRLESAPPAEEQVDAGREIGSESVSVTVADDGTFTLRFGDRTYPGLGALEDIGDRGDSYDFDPVGDPTPALERVEFRRQRHPGGIEELHVARSVRIPARLEDDRQRRSAEMCSVRLVLSARVAPGVERVDLRARLENSARDHRLRLLFPTHHPAAEFAAAGTFDVVSRSTQKPDATKWVHPAPDTFPHQGWISVNGLTLIAPGLPEAEVRSDGTIALTLARCVGWLSQVDLRTRPGPAGPTLATPGAQCLEAIEAGLALLPGLDPASARDAEIGLRAVAAGAEPPVPAGVPLLELEPRALLLSAFKPAESGDGVVLRVLNPSEQPIRARIRLGFSVSTATLVRLDETPLAAPFSIENGEVRLEVPAKALRSLQLCA